MPATKTRTATTKQVTTRTARPNDAVADATAEAPLVGELTVQSMTAAGRLSLKEALDALEQKPLWDLYAQEACDAMRNYFVERYMPLVRYTAERVYSRLPDEVDVDDLKSVGTFGLMDAIDSFDIEKGVKFETFCALRIRGAILDELRHMDWVPRLVRSRCKQVEAVRSVFQQEQGRKPTEEEISNHLNVGQDEVKKILRDGSAVQVTSLNRQRYQSDGTREVREIDVLRDNTQDDPSNLLQGRDVKDLLTKGLTRAERLIVILYYYEEMTMKEIGATLDLSESRVSQMHSSILARLKAQLQHREREFEPQD